MTLCSINFKTMDSEGKHFERTEFTLGEHYTVVRNITKYADGTVIKRYSVITPYEYRRSHYIPEIEYHDGFFDGEEEFTIQTTAYGSMNAQEIKKVIAGYQEAVEAVEILNKNFCNRRKA